VNSLPLSLRTWSGTPRVAISHESRSSTSSEPSCLAAVWDVVASKAEAIGKQFGVPLYTDMHDMMRREAIDVVVVLTESGLYAGHVVA